MPYPIIHHHELHNLVHIYIFVCECVCVCLVIRLHSKLSKRIPLSPDTK